MLGLVVGGLGSGKTLFLTMLSTLFKDVDVFANYSIFLPSVKQFCLSTFLNGGYENCVILLDEAYTYLESRVSTSVLNRAMSYMLFQSRKKGVIIMLTAQLLSTLDLRFRNLIDYLVICKKQLEGFYYTITDFSMRRSEHRFLAFERARLFFGLYNTLQTVNVSEETGQAWKFQIEEPRVQKERIQNYLGEIHAQFPTLKKFTKVFVRGWLFEHKNIKNKQLEDYLFIYLNNKLKKE